MAAYSKERETYYLCTDKIGDEFHFILECRELKDAKRKYLKAYYYKNVLKFY